MRKILLSLFQFLIPDPKAIKTFILKVIIVAIAVILILAFLASNAFQVCGEVESISLKNRQQTFIECWQIGRSFY